MAFYYFRMKSAFLILAHSDFYVLERLVSLLDDVENDIYVHFDAKVHTLPKLVVHYSRLFYTQKRIDIRWGDFSMLQGEYALWEEANSNGPYAFYHLLSGTHLPLKDQAEIRSFFDSYEGLSVISPLTIKNDASPFKMVRYNFFTRNFNYGQRWQQRLSQFAWKLIIRIQRILNIYRNRDTVFYKSSQWVSLSEDAVNYLLEEKKRICKKYRYSFCCDEFFVPTELFASSELNGKIVESNHLLYCVFSGPSPKDISIDDLSALMESPYLFARKFSDRNKRVADTVYESLKI